MYMKIRKRLIALFSVIVVMAMMMPMLVSAAPASSGTIKISAPISMGLASMNAEAYKLFSLTDVTGSVYTYSITDEAMAFINSNYYTFSQKTELAFKEYLQGLDSDSAEFKALTAAIQDYQNDESITSKKFIPVPFSGSNPLTSQLLNPGYYMLVVNADIPDHSTQVVAHCNMVTVNGNTEVNLKADVPSITKEVKKHDGSWGDWTDVNIGDIVNFKITSNVPKMFGYSTYIFNVEDTMSEGLTYKGNLEVYIGSVKIEPGTVTDSATTYTFTFNEDKNSFIIQFNNIINFKGSDNKDVVITYDAQLNEKAKINNDNANINKAIIEYSNNPYDSNQTGNTPKVEARVFTFNINIYKYTGVLDTSNSKPLSGAEFSIFKVSGSDPDFVYTEVKFVDLGGGLYRVAKDQTVTLPAREDNKSITVTLVSSLSGKIDISGLDAGSYAYEETKAPVNYNKIEGKIEFTIIHTEGNGQRSLTHKGLSTTNINVENKGGLILPGTGGIGTTILYACGGTLAIGIAVAYFISKRRERDDM